MLHRFFASALIFAVFLFLNSACTVNDDDIKERFAVDDDDTDNDDIGPGYNNPVNSLDDDDTASSDDDDDTAPPDDDDGTDDDDDTVSPDDNDTMEWPPDYLIESPLDGVRYFSQKILMTLDESLTDANVQCFLDNEALDVERIRWIDVDEGRHFIDLYIDGEFAASSEFEKHSSETANILDENFDIFPADLRLPDASGASTPIRFRLENTGSRQCSDINLRTLDQPDFRSRESIEEWIETETYGMSLRQAALYLFDFVGRWLTFAPPPFSGDLSSKNDVIPDLLQGWGYGYCSTHSRLFIALARMIGFDADETRSCSLSGHETAEIKYDDQWHLFDVSSIAYYWDSAGRILSLSEIEGSAAPLIADYTDQFGFCRGGSPIKYFIPAYESVSDNESFDPEPVFGDKRGFNLEPGDVMELYPFGFGLFMCADCPRSPRLTSTGVLHRRVSNPVGTSTHIYEPYPVIGLILQFETDAPNNAAVRLTLHGEISEAMQELNVSFDPFEQIDLSRYMDYSILGEIQSLDIEILTADESIDQMNAQVFFQYAPRLTPQITHDMRKVIIDANCEDLNLQVDVHDIKKPVSGAYIQTGLRINPDIRNDGKAMIALGVNVMSGADEWSAGHLIQVVSDHPDQVEILAPTSRVDATIYESVYSNWSGPSRFCDLNDIHASTSADTVQQMIFWARTYDDLARDLGAVTFFLLVDGEKLAQTQINFVAE